MVDQHSESPAAEAKSEESPRVISLEEISKHSSVDDMWMAINGKVYDVTKFVDEHPGGEEVLLDLAGKDATKDFEDVGHSEYAVELLGPLYVGEGDPEELLVRSRPLGVIEQGSGSTEGGFSISYVVVAVIVTVVGFLYLRATK